VSTIPAALDALVANFTAALPGVQVLDGQPVVDLADEVVVVGWQMERLSVTATFARQDAGTTDRETYDVAGLVSVVSGDTATKPVRDRAFEIYADLVAELRRDQTLGGVCMRARPLVVAVDQVQAEGDESMGGASVTIAWVVSIDAFDPS
jgi:hypothetical protein